MWERGDNLFTNDESGTLHFSSDNHNFNRNEYQKKEGDHSNTAKNENKKNSFGDSAADDPTIKDYLVNLRNMRQMNITEEDIDAAFSDIQVKEEVHSDIVPDKMPFERIFENSLRPTAGSVDLPKEHGDQSNSSGAPLLTDLEMPRLSNKEDIEKLIISEKKTQSDMIQNEIAMQADFGDVVLESDISGKANLEGTEKFGNLPSAKMSFYRTQYIEEEKKESKHKKKWLRSLLIITGMAVLLILASLVI